MTASLPGVGNMSMAFRLNCAACLLVMGLSLWLRIRLPIGGDVGFYLYLADKILHGGRYYYDFFENNFPMVFYIVALPVTLAKIIHIGVIPVYVAFIMGVSLVSLWLCAKVLRNTIVYKDPATYHALIFAVCMAFFLPVPTLSINEIGDKSFFLLAFILPYFFFRLPQAHPVSHRMETAVGLLAGIGFALKPHYLLIWLAIELYCLYRQKNIWAWRQRVNKYIAFVVISYALIILFVFPEYWHLALPLIPYFYLDPVPIHTLLSVNAVKVFSLAEPLILFFFLVKYSAREKFDEVRDFLLYGFTVACIEMILELHFEGLQRVQLYAFGLLLTAKLTVDGLRGIYTAPRLLSGAMILCFLGMCYCLPYREVEEAYDQTAYYKLTALDITLPYANRYAKGSSILALSPILNIEFPLVNYSGARWDFRGNSMPRQFWEWKKTDKSQLSPEARVQYDKTEKYFFTSLEKAMYPTPPALIFVWENEAYEKIFSISDYLQNPVFAREWKHYTKIDDIEVRGLYPEKGSIKALVAKLVGFDPGKQKVRIGIYLRQINDNVR